MLLTAVVALLLSAAPAQAATFRVTTTTDSTESCNGTDCPSIRSALAAAALSGGDDTIQVPAGEYQLVIGQLLVDSPVSIVGEGARQTTIRGNASAFRVLEVPTAVTASVSGVTMADGHALPRSAGDTFYAGGIVNNSGTLTLDRVRITNGHGSSGGGVANIGGTLTIERSLIHGNAADTGGADGGGLLNFAGGTLTVRNSTIASNSAVQAGALNTWGAPEGTPNTTTFEHVTVVGNQGGFRGGVNHSPGDVLSVRNSIIANNTAGSGGPNCGSPVTTLGGNVSNTTECALDPELDRQNVDVLLAAGLENRGGDTNVWPIQAGSPALDFISAGCTGTDQRGVRRPQGANCDSGAYERSPVRITNNPPTLTNSIHVDFEFTGDEPETSFECRYYISSDPEPPNFDPCASPLLVRDLTDGVWVFQVRPVLGAPVSHTFTVDTTGPAPPTITEPADGTAVRQGVTLRGQTDPQSTVAVFDNGQPVGAASLDGVGWTFAIPELTEGTHAFTTVATDQAGNASQPSAPVNVTVDRTPPAAPQVSGAPAGSSVSFTIAPAAEDVTLECLLEGPGQSAPFAPCGASQSYSGLAPGTYRFVVRATDRAGNVTETAHEFTVASVQPQITPTPTATPTPEFRETAVARPVRGTVLVRRPNSNEFVELDGSESIPMGSTIDTKGGRVRITAETQQGRPPQRAEFYEGIFRITQTRTLVDLRLVEELAPCPRRASAAQRKPKSRKLWGSGKGRFRTTGKYSSATVRGTTWLVQDTCAGTRTRVTAGVVAVRDKRLKRTVLVRKGKSYLARARR
jgi:Bacterial Ig-like domain